MPRILQAVGEVFYNGFTFPSALQSSISMEAVLDSANRTVKYYRLNMKLETIIVAGDKIDASTLNDPDTAATSVDGILSTIRDKLSEAGGELRFNLQGWGTTFKVNDGTNANADLAYGPLPVILLWEPVGSNQACRIVWTCVANVPFCANSTPPRTGAFIDWNEDMEWQIDEDGMTTRVITGSYEIPINRSGHFPSDTADAYRSRVGASYPVPVGFKRSQSWRLSRDKRTMEFRLVDSEIPTNNPYPNGITQIDAEHSMSSSLMGDITTGIGFTSWRSSFSADITLARGVTRFWAYIAFVLILKERLQRIALGRVSSKKPQEGVRSEPASILPLSLTMKESIFERRFSFDYTYLVRCNPEDLFRATGLFHPVKSTDWNEWENSLVFTRDPRGPANLSHKTNDDIIVDLCLTNEKQVDQPSSQVTDEQDQPLNIFQPTTPPAKDSWLHCQVNFEVFDFPMTQISHYSTNEIPREVAVVNDAESAEALEGFQIDDQGVPSPVHATIQTTGKNLTIVHMYGRLVRVGHTIRAPKLRKYGGHTAYKWDGVYDHQNVASSGEVPVYQLKFSVYYLLAGNPGAEDLNNAMEVSYVPEYCSR